MDSAPTIFISIACFMDPDVINTVRSLFAKADHPERVHVGICLQYDPDQHSFYELEKLPSVTVDRMPYEDARGPIYARYRCEQLLAEEDYFFQIDCHSRFFEHWDSILLSEYEHCLQLSARPVLTHYPINIQNMEDPTKLGMIGHLNRFRHIGPDAIKMHGTLIKLGEEPQPAYGLSAAMLFMTGATKKSIPYDPNLHYGLHAAEQFLYSARLWTHGCDFFSPTRHTIATEYINNRERIPKHVRSSYNQGSGLWTPKTWSKVKYCLGLEPLEQVDEAYRDTALEDLERYGMGSERSLEDYYRFIHLHEELFEYFPFYVQQHAASGNDSS